jgi:hypothetical protein
LVVNDIIIGHALGQVLIYNADWVAQGYVEGKDIVMAGMQGGCVW